MHEAPALLVAHVLLLVAWLGIDVGVFSSSFVMRRPGLSTETRLTVRSIMRNLDLAPRLSLILTVPVAVGLAKQTGWGLRSTPNWVVWTVFAAALVWATASVVAFRATGPAGSSPAWAARFAFADGGVRAAIAAFFVASGVWSLVSDGIWAARWVAWKATLFGVIVLLGLWIRVAARRYHPALAELMAEGESPERLARLNRDIRGVYPPVLMIWSLLIVMVIIGVYRP